MNWPITVDETKLYYFLALADNKYHTVFIGWLREEMIKSFKVIIPGKSYAHIKLMVGEHTFLLNIGAPLYIVDYENDDIYEFVSDDNELELFPSGKIPNDIDIEPVISFPSYFTKGIEPYIEFKLFNQFHANVDGVWVELNV